MRDAERTSDPWVFDAHRAALRFGPLTGSLDAARPDLGLQNIAIQSKPVTGHLLAIRRSDAKTRNEDGAGGRAVSGSASWSLDDAYVRGRDLVATYRPTDDWPFSPQVYWRADVLQPELFSSLALIVSVQTHLLETWPRIAVESQLHVKEAFFVEADDGRRANGNPLLAGEYDWNASRNAACILLRIAGQRLSYVEIMPASDFRSVAVQLNSAGECTTRWQLFADFLEKGVIWRARLYSLLLPREGDLQLAQDCCRLVEQWPLPLTT